MPVARQAGSALRSAGETGETAFTHAEKVMGTVVSFTVVPGDLTAAAARAAVEAACRVLHRADAVFSTWNPASPVSRLRRGEVTPDMLPAEVTEVLTLCQAAREASRGLVRPVGAPGRSRSHRAGEGMGGGAGGRRPAPGRNRRGAGQRRR